MPGTQQPEPGSRQGRRPRWNHAEISCGDFVTTLPDGKHVWIAVGPAAIAWRSLGYKIRHLAQRVDFRNVGVSFFIYMIGQDKSTASPKIIFCSNDEAARKNLRKAVRESDILKDYPSVGLGDSSSPLARSDSGLQMPSSASPKPARIPDLRQSQRAGKPRNQAGGQPSSSTHANIPSNKDAMGPWQARQDSDLCRNVNALSINDGHSDLSYDNSLCGTDSLYSRLSVFSTSDSTIRSSFDLDSAEQAVSETLTVKRQGFEIPENPENPNDCDSFSETDSSEEPTPLGGRRIPREEVGHVIKELLRAYDSYRQLPPAAAYHGNRQACKTHQQDSPSTASGTSRPPKRPIQSAEEALDENDIVPATDVKKARIASQTEKILACPFWKRDPRKFSRCFKFELRQVKNVKQHLKRAHKKPIHCPRCQVVFETEAEFHRHLRDETCSNQPEVEDSGVSGDQLKALHDKQMHLTEAQRWYVVWDIVFPGRPRPSSPYRDEGLSEDISEFREFLTRHGRTVILDHMVTTVNWTMNDELDRDSWDQAFDGGLEAVYNRWLLQRIESEGGLNNQALTEPVQGHSNNTQLDLSPSPDSRVQEDNEGPGFTQELVADPASLGQLYSSGLMGGYSSSQHPEVAPDSDTGFRWDSFQVANHGNDGNLNLHGDITESELGIYHTVFSRQS